MGTFANSEDFEEMLHHATFHQGLHCLLRQKIIRDRNINPESMFSSLQHTFLTLIIRVVLSVLCGGPKNLPAL